MTGVSHRGPVSGANGLGKIHLKFKPKPPPRGHRLLGVILYSILFFLIGLSFAWSRPRLRYGYVVPTMRRILSVIDGYKSGSNNLSESSDIIRDDYDVPTMFGYSLHDALKMQGKVHATDRLLQMEIYRRTAYGTLSEYYGNRTLESDKFWRLLNIQSLVENDYTSLSDENKLQLNAYTDGINTYLSEAIKTNTLSIDFTLLFGYELNSTIIQKWKPIDTLAILRMLSYIWSTGWEDQLRHLLISTSTKVNTDHLWKLETDINPEGGYITVSGAVVIPSIGSTIIAINKKRSTTKSSLLGSSIINMASHSGLWYLNNLKIKNTETVLSGASVPGVPFIFHGRNSHISWTFTPCSKTGFHQQEEIFIRSDPIVPDTTIDSKKEDIEVDIIQTRDEYIHIRGEVNPFQAVCKDSVLGPILTNSLLPIVSSSSIYHSILSPTEQLVLSSAALQKNISFFNFLYRLNSITTSSSTGSSSNNSGASSSFEEFSGVIQQLDCVGLQFVYADKEGNIGSVITGSMKSIEPPLLGWRRLNPTTLNNNPPINTTSMTIIYNPEGGILVASSNQNTAERVIELMNPTLSDTSYIAPTALQTTLLDTYSTSIMEVKSLVLGTAMPMGVAEVLVQDMLLAKSLIADFNGECTVDSVAAVVLEAVRVALVKRLLEPMANLGGVAAGGSFHAVDRLHTTTIRTEISWLAENLLSTHRDAPETTAAWRGRFSRDVREMLVIHAVVEALEWCREALGADTKHWQWGKAHMARYRHSNPEKFIILNEVLAHGPVPMSGTIDSIHRSDYAAFSGGLLTSESLRNTEHTPATSFRMVIDMSDAHCYYAGLPTSQASRLGASYPHSSDHSGSSTTEQLLQQWSSADPSQAFQRVCTHTPANLKNNKEEL